MCIECLLHRRKCAEEEVTQGYKQPESGHEMPIKFQARVESSPRCGSTLECKVSDDSKQDHEV